MSWIHRTLHGYHEWKCSRERTFQNKTVYADAIVTAESGDSDAPANWEVLRDGTPIARGHSSTVRDAKRASFGAMWKARQ